MAPLGQRTKTRSDGVGVERVSARATCEGACPPAIISRARIMYALSRLACVALCCSPFPERSMGRKKGLAGWLATYLASYRTDRLSTRSTTSLLRLLRSGSDHVAAGGLSSPPRRGDDATAAGRRVGSPTPAAAFRHAAATAAPARCCGGTAAPRTTPNRPGDAVGGATWDDDLLLNIASSSSPGKHIAENPFARADGHM